MLLGTLGVCFLGNLLAGKGTIATNQGHERTETLAKRANMPERGTIITVEGTIRAKQYF